MNRAASDEQMALWRKELIELTTDRPDHYSYLMTLLQWLDGDCIGDYPEPPAGSKVSFSVVEALTDDIEFLRGRGQWSTEFNGHAYAEWCRRARVLARNLQRKRRSSPSGTGLENLLP